MDIKVTVMDKEVEQEVFMVSRGIPSHRETQKLTDCGKTSGGHGRQHVQAPLAKEAKTGSAGYGKTVFNALKYPTLRFMSS